MCFGRSWIGFPVCFRVEFHVQLVFFEYFLKSGVFFTSHGKADAEISQNHFHLGSVCDLGLHGLNSGDSPTCHQTQKKIGQQECAEQTGQRP